MSTNILDKPIYALSIKQPWAWLICKGFKDVENRDWPTKFRGRIYVHSSLSKSEMTGEVIGWILERLNFGQAQQFKRAEYDASLLNLGAIIGEVNITGCVNHWSSPWFVGKWGFILANPVLYDKPIPCRGQLGFFKPNLEAKQ
jgi:hypothetical protein